MTQPYYDQGGITIYHGDAREILPQIEAQSIHTCVTSPPYWGLRSYLPDGIRLKADAPPSVLAELESLGIYPVDHAGG